MPKLYHLDGKPYHNTIEYSWVGIANKTGHDEYMVNPAVADYIEKLEDIIKGYEEILNLKKEQNEL